ncbi:hypothetical protein KKH27_11390 [bacterium]|nr:hypothetical protein [bacterium]MBU1983593.1 hypothetical protein [bacterium]
MKKAVFITLSFALLLTLGCCKANSPGKSMTFGAAPTLTETISIATLTAEPANYVNKDVLVTGEVVAMCMHKGCWVEVRETNGISIICRSLDESIHFTPNCMGKAIRCQGKLIYDPNAPGFEEKQHQGEDPHLCPSPKVLVSLQGATVDLATRTPSPAH